MGIMLVVVMRDFKESERLPGDLAAALANYDDRVSVMMMKDKTEGGRGDIIALRRDNLNLVSDLEQWLINDTPVDECYEAIRSLNNDMAEPSLRCGINPAKSYITYDLSYLSGIITRIDAIRSTGFIKSGFALLQVVVVVVLALLVFAEFKDPATQLTIVGFLSLIFIYLTRLIFDLDNPFAYEPDGRPQGAAEVSIEPLVVYRQRLAAMLAPSRRPWHERLDVWQCEAAKRLGYEQITRQDVLSALVDVLLVDPTVAVRVIDMLASQR